MKKITFLMLFIFSGMFQANATHLMGGEIIVRDLGNNEYQITLIAYRDTLGIPMTKGAVINFSGPNNISFSKTIPYDTVISGKLLPILPYLPKYPYGVEVYLFRDTVTLSAYGQWDISWRNCCRNGAILNLSSPLGESMTLFTSLVTDSASSNSSPFFLVPAAIFLPQNTAWQYNPLPFDPDGDSLHWSIDTPLNNVGVYCVGYVTPSSDTSNVFSIDPVTGTISWTADSVGNYVASILVEQYRNGVWVGEIRRDMQFIVVYPVLGIPLWNNLGGIPRDGNNNYAFDVPAGIPFHMEMIASHTDSLRNVYMGAYSEIFNLVQSNATFTQTIKNFETKGSLDWQPSLTDVRNNPYQIVFRVSDGFFTDDKSIFLNVITAIGLKENSKKTNVKIYPNPASNLVFIDISQVEEQTIAIDVYAINGQHVLTQKELQVNKGTNVFMLETSQWNSGTYVIRVQGEKGFSLNQMLIIE